MNYTESEKDHPKPKTVRLNRNYFN